MRLNMKMKYCFLLFALTLSSVINAQEVTMDFLKSSTWNYDRLLFQYAFTDDSIYMCYKLMCFGTTAKPYYLSSEPQRTFRDELVGKNEKESIHYVWKECILSNVGFHQRTEEVLL